MLIENAVDDFLFHCACEANFAENTLKAYRSDLKHFREFLGSKCLTDGATVTHLKAYLHQMHKVSHLSRATVRRRVACLRRFFAYAASHHDMFDPFSEWSPTLKRPSRLPRALSQEEAKSFFTPVPAFSTTMRETAWLALLVSSIGVRVSELCAMRVADVFDDGSAIRIRGKGARERVVFVGDKTLAAELASLRRKRACFGQSEAMFLNSRGAPLTAQSFRRRLHKVSSAGKLNRKVTPHMLRHTAATLLLEGGADIRHVQRLLGHSTIATTEIYTHVTDTALQNALRKANPIAGLRHIRS